MTDTNTTVTATQIAEADKLAAAVVEVRTLAIRFHEEGQDEMFMAHLDDLVYTWGQTAELERVGYETV